MKLQVFLLLVLIGGCVSKVEPPTPVETGLGINLPEGFNIKVFSDLTSAYPKAQPRFMEFYNGDLYVAIPSHNLIAKISDGKLSTVQSNLGRAHDFAFYNDEIYVAEETKVLKGKLGSKLAPLIERIPTGGHWTRTIVIHDGEIYLSVGSSCNVCNEQNEIRAAISKCSLDGSCKVIARGLRNSVGMVFAGDKLYATDNGRDMIGDNIPPEEINLIEDGKNYGWPFCYGNKIADLSYSKSNSCDQTEPPFVEMQAHSAPLGIAYYDSNKFPEEYQNKFFVAFHGSWNRNEKTGYKIVMVDPKTKKTTDFATGWLKDGKVTGRPVDIVVGPDSAMYVSDDSNGKIYRISYGKE